MLSAYKNTAYVLLGGALCKAWQLIFSCFSLCALVKRCFYYWYTQDQFIEVSDEVAEVFVSDARHEMAYQRRLSRHKAQYSLDCDDGIEYSACLHEPTPQELLERMELFIRLWNALNSLPEIQGRRIDVVLCQDLVQVKMRNFSPF